MDLEEFALGSFYLTSLFTGLVTDSLTVELLEEISTD